jgi:hypothetical protein
METDVPCCISRNEKRDIFLLLSTMTDPFFFFLLLFSSEFLLFCFICFVPEETDLSFDSDIFFDDANPVIIHLG